MITRVRKKHLPAVSMALAMLLFMPLGLQAQGKAVDNLYILGGELSNSAATSVADIDEVMPRMARLGLNTVLVPAYWEFIEPIDISIEER